MQGLTPRNAVFSGKAGKTTWLPVLIFPPVTQKNGSQKGQTPLARGSSSNYNGTTGYPENRCLVDKYNAR